MNRPLLLTITPNCSVDPSLAIAGCRAGAVGILDLQYVGRVDEAAAGLDRLEEYTDSAFGVMLGGRDWDALWPVVQAGGARLEWIVLADGDGTSVADVVAQIHAADKRAVVEATSVAEALEAVQAGADALILKGNEAGGRVGAESSFVLLQHWQKAAEQHDLTDTPFWIRGGVGPNVAAACVAGGAAGVVLDSQLWLTRESPLPSAVRSRIEAMDGSETILVGQELQQPYRLCTAPGSASLEQLQSAVESLAAAEIDSPSRLSQWRDAVEQQVRKPAGADPLLLCGQEVALAKSLADSYRTVGGVVAEITRRVGANRQLAAELQPLAADSPLARSHGTRFPLLQGPMTRVSDTAAFAADVADAGGLPFLALALMRGPEAEQVIAETADRLSDQPWGVGMLGFLPAQVRSEQTKAILKRRPAAAIIAGGRPDQARELEEAGIATYLHVPSPGLLRMFLRDGARRFIFEGRECGGHVGPRSSFVLWETMCQALLDHLGPHGKGDALHVVFAGGVHDALSSAMVAALAAPLAARGVKIGALMGTAYLFTKEAVESGAIVERFQREALAASDTVLLETGPGHAVRCAPTPYCELFNAEKQRLRAAGQSHDEIVQSLEWMNVGRLRVASKGLDRVAGQKGSRRELASVPDDQQYERGMYMLGQVAALRDEVTTMAQLHEDVCTGGSQRLQPHAAVVSASEPSQPACDIAIVGMSALYPGALNVQQYWQNILDRRDAVGEIPASHWDWKLYYDSDPSARDKIVSKWGGFLDDLPFDPLDYGIAPNSLWSIEPLQLLVLDGVRQALADAGYDRRPFDREHTCTVLGVGGGGSALSVSYGLRACLPMFDTVNDLGVTADRMMDKIGARLPEWTEDSFPGILLNVAAGRVANRFDFGGANYALDAACASSLAAVHACIRDLLLGDANVAIAIGADTVQTPLAYMAFSKTRALSARGRCAPFDAQADGIVLSEGVGVVVLKRLADAERDGDRIYAVIKGIGSSSDGRDKGLTAPNSAGQTRAIRRAMDQAGFSPADLTLIEAHGTGTVVGDRTEALSLSTVMQEGGAAAQSCALGSVKSMIGHSKCAAGMAGLIKTVKAIDCKTLPPTLVNEPNPHINFPETALYLNMDARPWVHRDDRPRRAGVSSFGFGGTNVHLVLQEYQGEYLDRSMSAQDQWPTELLLFRAGSRGELADQLQTVRQALQQGAQPALNELAAAVWRNSRSNDAVRVAVVASSLDDLSGKLAAALDMTRGDADQAVDPRGVYFSAAARDPDEKLALLFPGQGSQYPNMAADLAMNFPAVRRGLDHADRLLASTLDAPLGRYIYPPSSFSDEERQRRQQDLAATDIAQPAIGAVSHAMCRLMTDLGLNPDMVGGHSYGEFVALWAAGSLATDQLLQLSHMRGELIRQATQRSNAGGMVAVDGDLAAAEELAAQAPGVVVANVNAPGQTVLSGPDESLEQLLELADQSGLKARRLPVACAFHSPLVAEANEPLAKYLQDVPFAAPRIAAYSNVTADAYPDDAQGIRDLLSRHLASPVQFVDEIQAMYAAGARVFVEVGPGSVLTGLAKRILADQPHLAVATDLPGRHGLEQLAHALGQLAARGVPVELDELFRYRSVRTTDLAALLKPPAEIEYSASTWLVNGIRARPWKAPEPELIGTWPKEKSDASAAPAKQTSPSEAKSPASSPQASPAKTPSSTTQYAQNSMSQQSANRDDSISAPAASMPAATSPAQTQLAVPSDADDDVTAVMLGFQNVMSKFLDTQRAVMLGYLTGDGSAAGGEDLDVPAAAPQSLAAPQQPADQQASPAPKPHAADATPDRTAKVPVSAHAESSAPNNGAPTPEPQAAASGDDDGDAHDGWDIEKIGEHLLNLLSARTGYPVDVLDLDLDLEANLGIDSIKRVEILGELTESMNGAKSTLETQLDMEKLTSFRNLRGILEYLDELMSSAAANGSEATTSQTPVDAPTANGQPHPELPEIQRGLVRLVDAPLPRASAGAVPTGAVLLTDDGHGVARQLADRLADFGQETAIIHHRASGANGDDAYAVDLTCPSEVAELAQRIRADVGQVAGLLHVAPLAPVDESTDLGQRAFRDVKSLYLLAREFESDLRQAGAEGHAFLLAATNLGGELGYGTNPMAAPALASHGGVMGLLKCVALEWPEVLVRTVDFDVDRQASDVADALMRELGCPSGPVEVGYRSAARVTWEPVAAPLDVTDERERRALSANDTILITGGARGITAEIAVALAESRQPNLILVGRSPAPAADESPETAAIVEPADIKRALMARLQTQGAKAQPAEVEAAFRSLMRDRQIRNNLQRMRAAGATVEYHAVDVQDEAALEQLVADVTARYDGIDGVIHGAGVIDDKLLRDKTPESFDSVFGTKVRSAAALGRLLDFDKLQFCAFFASIASRYGNRGQSDYAAANEVLSKYAMELDRRWPARVFTVAWGPWERVGMVADLENHLQARGITLIEPEVGAALFLEELEFGWKGESEVLIAGGAAQLQKTPSRATETMDV